MTDIEPTTEAIYRALAQRLDEMPNGFPATESGAELRLLNKMFTLEEAVLGSVMTMAPEPSEAIAERAGVDPKAAYRTLKEMVRHGLVMMQREQRSLHFALMPFVVGSYEAQLPRIDAEFAALFEDYFQATRGLDIPGPSLHRVLPVGESLDGDVEIHPYEQAAALLEGAKAWGVSDCICRVQQHLIGKGCEAPIESCLAYAPVEGVFDGSTRHRALSKDEALGILRDAADAGLVHTVANRRDGHTYICNCCTCCCGVLRRVAEFKVPTAVARSAFRAEVDEGLCIGCGACEDRCPFDAIQVPAGIAAVDPMRCVGCGQCTMACPVDALHLSRLPESEILVPPIDEAAWQAERLAARENLDHG